MYLSKPAFGNFFRSWTFLSLQVLVLAVTAVLLEPRTGMLAGRLAFEDPKFHLYRYGLDNRQVTAVAEGPRGDKSDERGVFVNPDGTFKVEHLPVGEYSLRVRAPGFSTSYVNDLIVDEGKTTTVPQAVELSLLEPSANIATNFRVFTSKEQPSFWVTATGSKHISVKIYKKDFVKLANTNANHDLEKLGYTLSEGFQVYHNGSDDSDKPGNIYSKDKPQWQTERDISLNYEDSERVDMKTDKPLPPGEYVAMVLASDLKGKQFLGDILLFEVTDLGLIVKKAPDKVLVRAIDLNTLKPIAGAQIEQYALTIGSKASQTAITGKDGFATIAYNQNSLPNQGNESLTVVGTLGAERAFDGINYWQERVDRYHTYMYTDRPVYRLGQTVYFKGIARSLSPNGMVNPGKGVDLDVTVEDPEGNKLKEFSTQTNDHGTFHGVCSIPENGKTGGYQIRVQFPDNQSAWESFEVAEYRKPEYQVEVSPISPRVSAGDKAKARVKATYYFGAPVANARVKYSIYSSASWSTRIGLMPRPSYYQFFDTWDDTPWSSSDSGGDFVGEGVVQTDANGEAEVHFDTKAITVNQNDPNDYDYIDKNYRVEAEVTDISRMSVEGSGNQLVTPGDFELFVEPDSYVTKVGDDFHVQTTAIDYQGHPVVNASVQLKVQRWIWDAAKSAYRGTETVADTSAVTGSDGKVRSTFHCKDKWPSDTFYITAQTRDKGGHSIYSSASVWISSPDYPYVRQGEDAEKLALSVKTDKQIYRPGDVARVMVTAPVSGSEGADVIVALEGTRIYSYQTVPLSATAQMIEIPIKKEYIPNAYLTVSFVGKKHQFYNEETMIKVSPEQNFLNVSVSSDKAKYKPGETAKYTLKATHLDGRPAANTELSLAVVDESIYAIRADLTENIQKFFYEKRENWVTTNCSFPEQYSGGPDKNEPRVRKDFRDTAAWLPELKTDKNGIALASVKLPDNLTTWRATVRGVDLATDVGSTQQKITVSQDLIVRLSLPRFFTQGDQGYITAVVHNYTDRPQNIKLTLTPSPQFQIKEPLTHNLMVQPTKADRFNWPVTVAQSGNALVKVKAVGQTAGDAMEQHLPIRPLGIPAFSIKTGLLLKDDERVELPAGLAGDAAKGTVQCELDASASSIGPVVGNFNKLIDYPYGCTEQTMSRLVPSIVAYKLHQKLHLPLSKADEAKFKEVYKEAMPKLLQYHHSDGGWGWWENDKSQPYLTCLVLDGMQDLDGLKTFEDHASLIADGDKWLLSTLIDLHKQLSSKDLMKADRWSIWEDRTDFARMLNTLSRAKQAPKEQLVWLAGQYEELTPEALSYLTMALKRSGEDDLALKVFNRLISLANFSKAGTMDWDHNEAMFKRLRVLGVSDYSYRFTGVESTALALDAVLDMTPDNSNRIEAIKKWLLLQRDSEGWENTKTTAQVFMVLLKEELLAQAKYPPNFTYTAQLQDKLLKSYTFDANNAAQGELVTQVPVPDHPTKLILTKKGSGRLYYTNLITYFRIMKPGDQVAEKGTPTGLKLTRQFFRMVPVANKADGSMHFRTMPLTDGKIKAGETIFMKVTVDAPCSVPYVMVEAPLPSGAEVVQEQKAIDQNLEQGDDKDKNNSGGIEGDWKPAWWTHQDVLDDRIVFFCTSMEPGVNEFHTMLRMEMPGNINVDPVNMEGMYTNKVHAYSALDAFNITE